MSAWKNHSVLSHSETHDTLSLCFVWDIGRCVIDTIDVIHLKDSVVILKYLYKPIMRSYQKLLLEELEFEIARWFLSKLTISDLHRFLGSTLIIRRINGLNCDHYRIIILFQSCEILCSVEGWIYHANFLWELLFKAWWKLVGISTRKIWVCVETVNNYFQNRFLLEWNIRGISALLRTKVNGYHAFIVCIKFEVKVKLTVCYFDLRYKI